MLMTLLLSVKRTSSMTHGSPEQKGDSTHTHSRHTDHASWLLVVIIVGACYPCNRQFIGCLFEQQLSLTLIIRMRASLSPFPHHQDNYATKDEADDGSAIESTAADSTRRKDKTSAHTSRDSRIPALC